MDWKTYYRALNKLEKEAYAARAGTKRTYIENKLIFREAVPRKKLMMALADASLGHVSYDELITYFLKTEKKQKAA